MNPAREKCDSSRFGSEKSVNARHKIEDHNLINHLQCTAITFISLVTL